MSIFRPCFCEPNRRKKYHYLSSLPKPCEFVNWYDWINAGIFRSWHCWRMDQRSDWKFKRNHFFSILKLKKLITIWIHFRLKIPWTVLVKNTAVAHMKTYCPFARNMWLILQWKSQLSFMSKFHPWSTMPFLASWTLMRFATLWLPVLKDFSKFSAIPNGPIKIQLFGNVDQSKHDSKTQHSALTQKRNENKNNKSLFDTALHVEKSDV